MNAANGNDNSSSGGSEGNNKDDQSPRKQTKNKTYAS